MKIDKSVPIITIDGPSGTGKGTLCHMLADHLDWHVLDSGSIYRVLALAARKKGIELTDISKLEALACSLDVRFETDPHMKSAVKLENVDVYDEIRTEQCGQDASKIAILSQIRKVLLERQRAFAIPPGLVTDGRDMGTVVFPDAGLKIFLYASEAARAERRFFQLKQSGINVSLAKVVDELAKRDKRDTERKVAPLKPAKDAVLLDTTGSTIVQVFNNVLELMNTHSFFH